MPDVLAGHRFATAFGVQSAEGTAVANPEYQVPVYGGALRPHENRTPFQVADGATYDPGEYKSMAWGEGSIDFAAFTDSVGRLFKAHLGSDTKTGAGDPWTHTMISNNTPEWLTFWTQRPLAGASVEWDRFVDCLVKTVEVQYVSGQLLRIHADVLSKVPRTKATTPVPVVTNVLDSATNKFTWAAPTMKLDLDATPATTTLNPSNFQSFTIHMGYDSAAFQQTDQLTPGFRDLGRWTVSMSGTYLLQNWDAYYATFFGAKAPAANTDVSATVVRGSLDFLLGTDPVNANRTLQIQIPEILFSVDSPDPDVSGAGIKLDISGKLQRPASGQPLTVILKNGIATAY
jgi:hypothetical protein